MGQHADEQVLRHQCVGIDENHLINLVSLSPVGKRVRMSVLRRGDKLTIHVDLSDRAVAEETGSPEIPQQSKSDSEAEPMSWSKRL